LSIPTAPNNLAPQGSYRTLSRDSMRVTVTELCDVLCYIEKQ
ncbi:MAG: hypothetical protein JWN92_996, partial [Candidatus Acidoferrum typicum]|nr:hypothetical protein [Candidatus Acidoferrum typicum]